MEVDWLDILNQYGPGAFERSFQKTQQFEGTAQSACDEWGDIVPLDEYTVPSIPDCLLPNILKEIVNAIAQATETPIELGLFMVLGALSRAATGKFMIETELGFFEWAVLYLICVLPSGNRKTAALKLATAPLTKWEMMKAEELEPAIRSASTAQKNEEAALKKLRNRLGGKTENPEDLYSQIEKIESNLTKVPFRPRLLANDITPERLATLMAEQNERIGLVSDEGGMFEIFGGRYSSGTPNLDLYLKAYDGSPVYVDRQTAPSVYLKCPLITTAICPQPSVLEALTKKPEFRGRGLVARFLYATPVSPLGFRTGKVSRVPNETRQRYEEMIFAVLNFEPLKEV